jgi:hypothetical protein
MGVRKRSRETEKEMRSEYRFDYAMAKRNRFADHVKPGALAIILDPDVAAVFHSSEAVNTLLRSVISAMPGRAPKRAKTG